jgi:transcription initiation factor TFIIIB Brf1 subunit/transcription initiation factor TFIIB
MIMKQTEQWCISHCLGCPECDSNNIEREETDETPDLIYFEAVCFDCGLVWCEIEFADAYYDEED